MQQLIQTRATTVPAGGFITAMGGWYAAQLKEKRLPTLQELDTADPNRPGDRISSFHRTGGHQLARQSILLESPSRRQRHRRDRGQRPFPSCIGPTARRADLRRQETRHVRRHGLRRKCRRHHQRGYGSLFAARNRRPSGRDGHEHPRRWKPVPAYCDAFTALHEEGKMIMRLRLFFLSMDTRGNVPLLTARLDNTLMASTTTPCAFPASASSPQLASVRPGHPAQIAEPRSEIGSETRLAFPAAQPLAR